MNDRIEELGREAFGSSFDTDPILVYEANVFAELIVKEYAEKLVLAHMTNPAYQAAMDKLYEAKWAHRFD